MTVNDYRETIRPQTIVLLIYSIFTFSCHFITSFHSTKMVLSIKTMFKEVQKWYSFCIKDVKKMYERYFKEELILLSRNTYSIQFLMSVSEMAYEMARDEARHGKAFEGLLARYFG